MSILLFVVKKRTTAVAVSLVKHPPLEVYIRTVNDNLAA